MGKFQGYCARHKDCEVGNCWLDVWMGGLEAGQQSCCSIDFRTFFKLQTMNGDRMNHMKRNMEMNMMK